MADLRQDLELWAGYDWTVDVDLFDMDGVTPLPLAGLTLRWFLADIYDRSSRLIEKTSDSTGQILLNDPGGATVVINGADTAHLGGQPYCHELSIVDSGGTMVPALSGTVTILKSILASESSG